MVTRWWIVYSHIHSPFFLNPWGLILSYLYYPSLLTIRQRHVTASGQWVNDISKMKNLIAGAKPFNAHFPYHSGEAWCWNGRATRHSAWIRVINCLYRLPRLTLDFGWERNFCCVKPQECGVVCYCSITDLPIYIWICKHFGYFCLSTTFKMYENGLEGVHKPLKLHTKI